MTKQSSYLLRLFLPLFGVIFLFGCSEPDAETLALIENMTVETIPLPEGNGNLAYVRAGDIGSQKVIFLHGTPGSRGAWNDYIADVPAGLEYILVDRPAFGDSDPKRVLSP